MEFILIVLSLLLILYYYFKHSYYYWKMKNVPYLEPRMPFGNIGNIVRGDESVDTTIKHAYSQIKKNGWKHAGVYLFSIPAYLVIDPEYIKNITSQDFQYFTDRPSYCNEKDEPINAHILNLTGERWKVIRKKLTPTFTSGKLRRMFSTLVCCGEKLKKYMKVQCERNEPLDIKEIAGRFTTDIIASVVYGLDSKSLEDDDSPFRIFGKKSMSSTKWQELKKLAASLFPKISLMLRVTTIQKDVKKFFTEIVEDTVKYREVNTYAPDDFLQLLIEMKNQKSSDDEDCSFTMNEIVAQTFFFFVAGFDTTSTLLTFALYELAKNQHIQDKLRSEIESVLNDHNGEISYDSIQEMVYMDQIINETLRKHPPVTLANRRCVKDYKLPTEEIIIDKGTIVLIPIAAIHYDEDYYPDPEKFDPERFSKEYKHSRPSYTFLPFGKGLRDCIGMRFAMMQSKVGLLLLIKNFKFTVNERTKEPFRIKPGRVILTIEGGIWLDAKEI